MMTMEQFLSLFCEESAAGHSHKRVIKWLKINGYQEISNSGKHPKFVHTQTNHVITGVNVHNKDNVNGVRGMISAIKTHHTNSNIQYFPLDSKIDSM